MTAEALAELHDRLEAAGDQNLARLSAALYEKADASLLNEYGASALEDLARRGLEFLREPLDEPRVTVIEPGVPEAPSAPNEPQRAGTSHAVVMLALTDRPFIVDSVQAQLRRSGYRLHHQLHPVLNVARTKSGQLEGLLSEGGRAEAFELFFVDPLTEREEGERLAASLTSVLQDVVRATDDYGAMLERSRSTENYVRRLGEQALSEEERAAAREYAEFLAWLTDGNFVYLGYREYRITSANGERALETNASSGLGVLSNAEGSAFKEPVPLSEIPHGLRERITGQRLLTVTKTNREATVHRARRMDYVGVKRFTPAGEVASEDRFLGLFTTKALAAPVTEIPILRQKLTRVLELEGVAPGSHRYKAITAAFNSMPREELFWADPKQIRADISTILRLEQERQVRLTLRADPLGRGVAVMLVVPAGNYSEQVRLNAEEYLTERLQAERIDSRLVISEDESHVRQHFFFITAEPATRELEQELESRVARLARNWRDVLAEALQREHGPARGAELLKRYGEAFDERYRAHVEPELALADIRNLERLGEATHLVDLMSRGSDLELRVYHPGHDLPLSDVLPLLENLGFFVLRAYPYALEVEGRAVGVDVYAVRAEAEAEREEVRLNLSRALTQLLRGEAENDALNALVLRAGLSVREVALLRLYAMYYSQVHAQTSREFINRTLLAYPEVASSLMRYYDARFAKAADGSVELTRDRESELATSEQRVVSGLEAVRTLAEDQVLRGLLDLMRATVRSTYYLGLERISIKIDSSSVSVMPEPRPMYEIAVTGPGVDGTHLRGGKVARGGIRWSDRPDDFRTEVLGLLKTQTTKNAVIVPVGSKGGFVLKGAPQGEELRAYVREQYQTYIRGLLDLTDNLVDGRAVHPEGLVIYDDEDPYLVVAADKGTATFSDLANETAAEYGFWLGDAFASGGSAGYDHKGMGITARGAWEAVKRHFAEEGIDMRQPFTVAGIGDMSGDVFGNGMLYTDKIRLQAAFNHLHIFLDPDPDPAAGYEERRRLFELPRSTWNDYDRSLISAGGGVFERSAKSIPLSPEARGMLGVEAETLSGEELIRAVLRMPTDLLWNGGIGTYVKASAERHAEVGDSANDGVRVNGGELRARVVGEGGNLGFTQLGRIEYALTGGRIDTDAIDNSAGVDSSDIEVNIKILLQPLTKSGQLETTARNDLLREMTDEVARLVLRHNTDQARALSLAQRESAADPALYASLLDYLVESAGLDPKVEFLPTAKQLEERRLSGAGLTRPELAIMLAYVKMGLYNRLLETELPGEAHLRHYLHDYFPHQLRERYPEYIDQHQLSREITATMITNELVDNLGLAFVHRVMRDNGASAIEVVRATLIAIETLGAQPLLRSVKALGADVPVEAQYQAASEIQGALEASVGWLLFNNFGHGDFERVMGAYGAPIEEFRAGLRDYLTEPLLRELDARIAELRSAGFEPDLAAKIAGLKHLPAAFGAAETARNTGVPLSEAARTQFALADALKLGWLMNRLAALPTSGPWEKVALTDLAMDLRDVEQRLSATYLRGRSAGGAATLEEFLAPLAALERYERALASLKEEGALDLAGGTVMVRLLRQAEAAAAKEL